MRAPISARLLRTQPDHRLVALAGDGHERAFEALVHRYHRLLLAHARRVLTVETSAEDVVQQALLQAWLALQRGTEVSDVKPWLYRIVHNTALRAQRTAGINHAQLTESLESAGTPHEQIEQQIAARDALAGVASLPTLQREAILLAAVDGRRNDEVAAALGVSDGALRGLLYRARVKLRNAAGALIPFPVTCWAANASGPSESFGERLSEAGVGAGLAGALVKGGAIALTTGAVVIGVGAVHSKLVDHETPASHPPSSRVAVSSRRVSSPASAGRFVSVTGSPSAPRPSAVSSTNPVAGPASAPPKPVASSPAHPSATRAPANGPISATTVPGAAGAASAPSASGGGQNPVSGPAASTASAGNGNSGSGGATGGSVSATSSPSTPEVDNGSPTTAAANSTPPPTGTGSDATPVNEVTTPTAATSSSDSSSSSASSSSGD